MYNDAVSFFELNYTNCMKMEAKMEWKDWNEYIVPQWLCCLTEGKPRCLCKERGRRQTQRTLYERMVSNWGTWIGACRDSWWVWLYHIPAHVNYLLFALDIPGAQCATCNEKPESQSQRLKKRVEKTMQLSLPHHECVINNEWNAH